MVGKKKQPGKDYKGWGGRRSNQEGRPKEQYSPVKGTKMVRVSADVDVKALVSLADDLKAIVGAYQVEADSAKASSVTGEYPRTYDVALRMIDELASLLHSVNTLA